MVTNPMKLFVPLLFLLSFPALADSVTIVDVNTWKHGGITIRLHGIDAPELDQTCIKDDRPWMAGQAAKRWAENYFMMRHVQCFSTGQRSYGRIVANCYVNGESIQGLIVRNGWAFDDPRYSGGKYKAFEMEARKKRLGIWKGHCATPYEWRRQKN